MSFLQAGFLFSLPLVLVPILIHFFKKPPKKTLVFSHVSWVKEFLAKQRAERRPKDILQLLLRMLIVFFLILYFAHPVLNRRWQTQSKEDRSATVLMLDLSASMGAFEAGVSGLDRLKMNVRALLERMPQDERIGWVAFSDRLEWELPPSKDRLPGLRRLDDLKGSARPTDVAAGFIAARKQLLPYETAASRLILFSDMARHGWKDDSPIKANLAKMSFPPLHVLPIFSRVQNGGVVQARLVQSVGGEGAGSWTYRRSNDDALSQTWTASFNNKGLVKAPVSSKGESLFQETFSVSLANQATYGGWVRLSDDDAEFDNTFYLAGRMQKGYRLTIVDGDPGAGVSDSETFYLKTALQNPPDARILKLDEIRLENVTPALLRQTDLLVLANTGELGAREEDLAAWMRQGGHVFISMGRRWPADKVRIFGLEFAGRSNAADYLSSPDQKNPWFRMWDAPADFQWTAVQVSDHVKIPATFPGERIISLAKGDPLLFYSPMGAGGLFVFTTTLDRHWTNFPSKPVYAPFFREMLALAADPLSERGPQQSWVDEAFEFSLPAGVSRAMVVAPNGVTSAAAKIGAARWRGPVATGPGLYRIVTNDSTLDASYAVNQKELDAEGRYDPITEGEIRNFLPLPFLTWTAPGPTAVERLYRQLAGRDIQKEMGWILLVLFLLESALVYFGSRGRRRYLFFMVAFFLVMPPARAGHGNRFVFTLLKHDGAWDPYPSATEPILEMAKRFTNMPFDSGQETVSFADDSVFDAPFIWVKGQTALRFSSKEKERLKLYLDRGGLLFFDDTSADARGPFLVSIKAVLKELYPSDPVEPLSADHAVYRSFFLLRGAAGRRQGDARLWGLTIGGSGGGEGRTAVLLSANDLLGVWVKDPMGRYLYDCEPGGEPQRWDAQKLTINIMFFSLTGTYKKDAVHQPFIEKKLSPYE